MSQNWWPQGGPRKEIRNTVASMKKNPDYIYSWSSRISDNDNILLIIISRIYIIVYNILLVTTSNLIYKDLYEYNNYNVIYTIPIHLYPTSYRQRQKRRMRGERCPRARGSQQAGTRNSQSNNIINNISSNHPRTHRHRYIHTPAHTPHKYNNITILVLSLSS